MERAETARIHRDKQRSPGICSQYHDMAVSDMNRRLARGKCQHIVVHSSDIGESSDGWIDMQLPYNAAQGLPGLALSIRILRVEVEAGVPGMASECTFVALSYIHCRTMKEKRARRNQTRNRGEVNKYERRAHQGQVECELRV